MAHPKKSPYLRVPEATAFLRLRSRTLDNMCWKGIGPKYRKHGGRIVYHVQDLTDWSQKNGRPLPK
jgi:hypothetical protein